MTPDARPKLVRRARLRWDEARATHVLLVPEGVLVLNEQAADVLSLCDGARPLDAIVTELRARYPEAPEDVLTTDVTELLDRLAARGYVEV